LREGCIRVRNAIFVSLLLVFLIISAGCTVYEKEEDHPVFDATPSPPQPAPVSPVSPAPPVPAPAPKPVSVNPATGYPMENLTPEVTAVPQPYQHLMRYHQVYSQQFRLMYRLEGPYGLEIVCNQAPLRIQFDSSPDHTNPQLSYAYWELTDMETGDIIRDGGFSGRHSTQKKQVLDIPKTGSFHLNLYGARINVRVTVLSPHAGDLVVLQPQAASPEEEEYYW